MVKMIEEDEDEYTDVDEQSDQEDSDSEPSDDNLSKEELDQWHISIIKRREEYINTFKRWIDIQESSVNSQINV